MTDLQALRLACTSNPIEAETNPFAPAESSHHPSQPKTNRSSIITDRNHHHLKLSFPKIAGEDHTGWIYNAEQYFDFKDVAPAQQVQLASFHLDGIAL